MNVNRTARKLKESRDQTAEIEDDSISLGSLRLLAEVLNVNEHIIYVSCGAGEKLKVSIPVSVPIRTVPMGEKP